jgi:hypothetical protein
VIWFVFLLPFFLSVEFCVAAAAAAADSSCMNRLMFREY